LYAGGFGSIYEAKADDGSEAVVKLVPKVPGARRELLFENLSGLPNIIPILDKGEWKDYYVIVMPRAEKSLRQHLEEAGGKFTVDEAVAVLIDVAVALESLKEKVVHRDLKPENVLLYKGHWCLADFGIARYAEATTAPDTRKFAKTPPYAAPEQWREEKATHATDVYAFGIMAFEFLQGKRPFPGPEIDDFHDQHLNQLPPAISGCPLSLASLVNECLFKASAARPTSANILARLRAGQRMPSIGMEKLQKVYKSVVEKLGEEGARKSAQQSREETRRQLFQSAEQSFRRILLALRERVLEAAPTAGDLPAAARAAHDVAKYRARARGDLTILYPSLEMYLGDGALIIDPVQMASVDCLAAYDYAPPFDVIAYTVIAVRKPRDQWDYEGRAHSLWFCDAHDKGVYRWYELAFMITPGISESYTLDPFALSPTDEKAAGAFTPVMTVHQIAWQPLPFDQGNEEQFIERWLAWFAGAVDGSISMPSHMPEQSGGRYRQARRAK
jgi:hypothetical protein